MGCRWRTVGGKRVRTGPVSGPVNSTLVGSFNVTDLLHLLNISQVMGSPVFTSDELRQATFRLYLNSETGYWLEVKRGPGFPPGYWHITEQEAIALEGRNPAPSFIAHMFHWPEVPVH